MPNPGFEPFEECIPMRVAVIGLGYVGLPLALEFAKAGLAVVGIDKAADRVASVNSGQSHILDVSSVELGQFTANGLITATTDFSELETCDAACICVPTPLGKSKDPDVSYIAEAVSEIAKYIHKGMVIVLESTTYPGTTEELILPALEESGLKAGVDFYLAFSPERVDPGNKEYTTRNTPKVIGGVTPTCTDKAVALYRHAIDTPVPVSSAQTAELVKLLENTFRAINIGLANELALMCERLNIDVWEVVNAAKTKPFGFMPFYPGPGLGGHCIPIDPLYLSWKLKTVNYTARFIELATAVNSGMPEHLVTRLTDLLNSERKCLNGSRLLILGVAYKKDVCDVRESPAVDIITLLERKGAEVRFADPYVETLVIGERTLDGYDLKQGIGDFDCVCIITDHSAFDYPAILDEAKLVFDARNATAGLTIPSSCRVVKL
jgi:UDP-N-acetyl-D-glucosamine dehydrogenase